ncbi:MAG TPA: phospholipase D-like domain-containing protein, partial [Thermodesulfobacteriota bacterium]|nr:phospholipase D-like domain-containing protein [Thermodesulfobacteriota bacterium]
GCGESVESPEATLAASEPVGDPEPPAQAEAEAQAEPPPPPAPPPPSPATGREELRRLCFSPKEDCVRVLLGYLQSETQAIDMAIYHLYDRRISQILVDKHRAGVRVRVLADRHAYTSKPQHAREMNFLASNGVPVRTNRHRGILHHKMTILHGLGLVQHGSMNYTSVASRKVFNGRTGQIEWIEEVAFFTTNPLVFARFRERFERMWANTGDGQETFQIFTAGMVLPNFEETELTKPFTRYENPVPDPKPLPDDPALRICFAPDQNCNTEVLRPIIERERTKLDIFMFRATSVEEIGNPLVARVKEGLPIRIIFERSQYRNELYPSMTRIIDALWAANTKGNLRLKTTAHSGAMHMKSLITPELATWGSGNFTKPSSRRVRGLNNVFYQDEDMVIARDPALVAAMQARFDEMWASPDFADFDPSAQEEVGEVPDQ